MVRNPGFAHIPDREIELDFIRGIAILMVVDFHSPRPVLLLPFLWMGFNHFGWAGVDLFFVLSGFLIGGLLIKESALFGTTDGKRFLVRRAMKLWPQYYVLLAFFAIHDHVSLYELRANLIHLQNLFGPFSYTWSLAVEEQVYIVIVLLFVLASKCRGSAAQTIALFAALSVLAVAVRFVLTVRPSSTFIILTTRVDSFFYGAILAILYHEFPDRFRNLQRRRWLLGVILAAALVGFRFPAASAVGVGLQWIYASLFAVTLLLLLQAHSPLPRPFLYRMVARIGIYSYGIFLWHLAVIPEVFALEHRIPHALYPAWESIMPYVFAIPVGILTTRCIETPVLHLRDRLFPRRIDSPVGIPAILEEVAQG